MHWFEVWLEGGVGWSDWEQIYIVIILASVDCTWTLWWRWNRIQNWRVLLMHRCLCLGKYHQQQDPRKMSYKFAISCNSGKENRSISFSGEWQRDWHLSSTYRVSPHLCRSSSVECAKLLPIRWTCLQMLWIDVFLEWCDQRFDRLSWRMGQSLRRTTFLLASFARRPPAASSIIHQRNHFVHVLVTIFAASHVNHCNRQFVSLHLLRTVNGIFPTLTEIDRVVC